MHLLAVAVILVAVATVMVAAMAALMALAVAVVGVGTNNWEYNSRLCSSIHYRPLAVKSTLNNQEN